MTHVARLTLASPEATDRLARAIAPHLGAGDVLLLEGPVGAGKSHLARALIRARLGEAEEVPSPTFTLVQVYGEAPEIWHSDLYRLSHPDEIAELGLEEAFATAICLVEWPDRLGPLAPPGALRIALSPDGPGEQDGEGRRAAIEGGPRWWPLIAALAPGRDGRETGVGETGVGETGVGETGVGETGVTGLTSTGGGRTEGRRGGPDAAETGGRAGAEASGRTIRLTPPGGGPGASAEETPLAGSQDGGTQDAGTKGGGPHDAGAQDGGTKGGGAQDAGMQDGGPQDGGPQDGGTAPSGWSGGPRTGAEGAAGSGAAWSGAAGAGAAGEGGVSSAGEGAARAAAAAAAGPAMRDGAEGGPEDGAVDGIPALLAAAGWGAALRRPLAGDASARRYERLSRPDGSRAVLMLAPAAEAGPFLRIAAHLAGLGLSAPRILGGDPAAGVLLIEDLGDGLFTRLLAAAPEREAELYAAAVDLLPVLQAAPAPEGLDRLDPGTLGDMVRITLDWYAPRVRSVRSVRSGSEDAAFAGPGSARTRSEDAGSARPGSTRTGSEDAGSEGPRNHGRENGGPRNGGPLSGGPEQEGAGQQGPEPGSAGPDGAALAAEVADLCAAHAAGPPVLVHRDYHAGNLLWLPERAGVARVGLIDFQDAVTGPAAYDLVSLLRDARRDLGAGVAEAMLRRTSAAAGVAEADLGRAAAVLGVQRNLRILGVFARLCLRDGKAGYLDLMPRVWGHLMADLSHPALAGLAGRIGRRLPPPEAAFRQDLRARCGTCPDPR